MMKLPILTALLTGVAATSAPTSVQAAPIIKEVTPATLQSAIRAQKGRVVVVNFWATWCAPCVAELPAFAQLQKQYGKRGVTVLLVSADEASAKPLVSKTLASRGHAKTYLIKGDMVKFFDGFDPKFKGAVALPRTYVYNRAGQAAKAVNSEHTFAQYAKMVAPYL